MDLPPELLAAFPPSGHLLLDVARRPIDDGMLQEIAAADYGEDVEEHLRILRPIRDTGVIPVPLRWHPGEVLELFAWSNPEDPAHKPGSPGLRGHQMRAFACAVLLSAVDSNDECYSMAPDATLAQCLGSAHAIGTEMSEAAARFLTWCIPRMPMGSLDRLCFIGGLLVVATRLHRQQVDVRVLDDLAEVFLVEEPTVRQNLGGVPIGFNFGIQQSFWEPLAAELLREAAAIPTVEVRDKLEFVGALISR